jgi:tRNA-dihydrouridine synthase
MITVHGRTRQQFYKGRADWTAIRAVREQGDFPLVANGDIQTVADARDCLSRSGADAVMMGRAALGRPWLVGAIGAALAGRAFTEPALAEKAAMAREHYEGLLSLMGVAQGVRHARKHLAAYADDAVASGCMADAEERRQLLTGSDPARVIRALERLFARGEGRAAA